LSRGTLGEAEEHSMPRNLTIGRRRFLEASGHAVLAATARALAPAALTGWDLSRAAAEEGVDHTIRIAPVSLEIGPNTVIQTTAYNGSVPGPPLRLKEGARSDAPWL
jgi:FtsP/CotA-like multicopper oxidase with cupredoxin domain